MIQEGLKILRDEGLPAVVLLGHPDYYPKFGFRPASAFGIQYGYRVPDEAFMAIELRDGALKNVTGLAKYHCAFEDAQIGPPAR
jgi:putative acetyltransferase